MVEFSQTMSLSIKFMDPFTFIGPASQFYISALEP
jgi:hypothetical protein